jgi:N-acetyl-anhydromuramyl-L-alanine amidase AmpD
LKFIAARHYTPASGRRIEVVVIHTMESPERPETAEQIARWFAGPNAPQASAHYCLDDKEVVQGVRDEDVAWAAPGANHNGLQLEHAGYARQTAADWHDAYSQAMLKLSAKLTARLCWEWGIPIRWLTADDLKAGKRGITSHANVSAAFHKSTHWDPGPAFPHEEYIEAVRGARRRKPVKPQLVNPPRDVKAQLDEAIGLLEGSWAAKRGHRRVVGALRILRRLSRDTQ